MGYSLLLFFTYCVLELAVIFGCILFMVRGGGSDFLITKFIWKGRNEFQFFQLRNFIPKQRVEPKNLHIVSFCSSIFCLSRESCLRFFFWFDSKLLFYSFVTYFLDELKFPVTPPLLFYFLTRLSQFFFFFFFCRKKIFSMIIQLEKGGTGCGSSFTFSNHVRIVNKRLEKRVKQKFSRWKTRKMAARRGLVQGFLRK